MMKRLILILTLVLPVTLMAQEKQTDPIEDQPVIASLAPAAVGPMDLAANASPGSRIVFLQPSREPQQTSRTAQPGRVPGPGTQRPRPEGSMVGYIDNAIIGNQLRVRFDAGFHTQFPDRAEFFYAKCGCYQALAGSGLPSFDPNAPGPHPGVATKLNFQQLYVNAEYAPISRVSFFGEIPVRWLQPKSFVPGTGSFSNQSGLGDIRVGAKLAVIASDDRYLTFQFRVDTPSGDEAQGLGTGHTSVEPGALYYERLTARLAIESQFSFWHPIGGSDGVASAADPNPDKFAGNVLFYGIGPSYELYNSDRVRFGPVVELAGWHVLSGFQTVWVSANRIGDKVEGTDIVNLKVGVRTSIGAHNSIYVGYGRALTDAWWYKEIVRAEYRYSF